MDEFVTTNWLFFTPLDNLSFLGGLLDIGLLVPTVLMFAYTFRLNEIQVFYHEQLGDTDDQNDEAKHTVFSKYLEDNSFTISFKILLYLIVKLLKLNCLLEWVQTKRAEWKKSQAVSVRDPTP